VSHHCQAGAVGCGERLTGPTNGPESGPKSGHRTLPHPADITIEAWGPTRETCLAEAVIGLAASFADFSDAPTAQTVVSDLTATNDGDRLVATLDELIYLLDTQGLIPVSADVDIGPQALRLTMQMASMADVQLIGAAPKAVAFSGLEFSQSGNEWRCRATIDA
jgi:SHS2 domain-containing protein